MFLNNEFTSNLNSESLSKIVEIIRVQVNCCVFRFIGKNSFKRRSYFGSVVMNERLYENLSKPYGWFKAVFILEAFSSNNMSPYSGERKAALLFIKQV